MRRAFQVFLVTTVLGLIVIAWGVRIAWKYGDTPSGPAFGRVDVDIPKGATAVDVAERLAAVGLIARPAIFRLYAGQRGVAGRFKAGHYTLNAPASPKQILDALVKGVADELVTVTIPEGKNLVEIADILEAAGVTSKPEFITLAVDASFAASLDLPGPTVEGYLFPDTYRLRPHTPAPRALIPMIRRHRQVFEELRAKHTKGVTDLKNTLGFDDYKIVILASI
ncbi:MAG TPA: endolytic transglycosylase MltG, partial [Polyangia bacterium]